MGSLDGKLAVLGPEDAERAADLAGEGAAVVVAGTDAAAVGRVVGWLRAGGGRVAGFIGSAADPAVAEMAAELFPGLELLPPTGGVS